MAATQRRRRGAQTATEAVEAAQAAGTEVPVTTDAAGNTFAQRPFDLGQAPATHAPAAPAGGKVKVYHKRGTKMFLSDGSSIGPYEEKHIPAADVDHPKIAPYIVRLAE